MTTLATPRCTLRPIASGDVEMLHALWTSPGVRRYLWDDEIIPIERTADIIARSERMFADHGYGLWGAWANDQPRLRGFGGLWPFRDPPELELLYGVAEDLWGHGYATEIAQAVVGHCLEHLGMALVRASTDVGNEASIRVLEKIGFAFDRRAAVQGLDTVFYQLQRHGC